MNERGQMIELLVRLEQSAIENADAFVVVTTDRYTGDTISACGPFLQAEQALAEAGRMDARWRLAAEDAVEADSLSYIVVPMWAPTIVDGTA